MSKYGINHTPKEVTEILGVNIRALRKERKLSRAKLSEISGVAYASIRKFEETGSISLESLLMLSKALGRLDEFESLLLPDQNERRQKLFDI